MFITPDLDHLSTKHVNAVARGSCDLAIHSLIFKILGTSTGQTMSSPSESEQRQLCSVFSKGLYCPKGKNCPLIHKWALCNAAKKVRRLAKLNNNHGDAGNKTCAKKHGNTSVDMPQAKNIKPGDSRNGTMVPIQDVEAQTPSAAEGEHQQPLKDVQFSKPGKSQHKNGGKKVSENVDHVQPANSADNSPKSMKDAKLFKLSNPSPNMSYGQHADEQTTKGKLLHSIPLRQQPNHVISINTPALSINTQRANSRWPKATNHRDSHANAPGARATQDIKNRNTCNDQATQLGDIRSVRYVLSLGITVHSL